MMRIRSTRREATLVLALMCLVSGIGCGVRGHGPDGSRDYDFGPLFADATSSLEHIFDVKNTGKKLFNVTNVLKSCTCTEAELESKVIPPGESRRLRMKVKPGPSLGGWKVLCTLETDHPDIPLLAYTPSYRIYPRIRFSESELNLGHLGGKDVAWPPASVGEGTWVELYETALTASDSLESIEAPSPLTVEVDRRPVVDTIEGGSVVRSRYRLRVGYDPGAIPTSASGIHSATISGKTRSGHASSLPILWSVSSPLQASPDPLTFGLVKPTDGASKKHIIVRSTDGVPFRVLAIEGGGIAVSGEEDRGPSGISQVVHSFDITLISSDFKRKYINGNVIFKTDHPGMQVINVPWTAILRE